MSYPIPTASRVGMELACLTAARRNMLCRDKLSGQDAEVLLAQVDVLERWLNEDEVLARFSESGSVQSAALDAAAWLSGHKKEPPSKRWKMF